MRTFFVTSVTFGRRTLFRDERLALLFIEKMNDDRHLGRYEIHEFVLMPDHLHLMVSPSPSVSLEKAAQFLKGGFSYLVKKRFEKNLEIWQPGFTFESVKSLVDYERCRSYIWQNPVRRGLVERAEDYECRRHRGNSKWTPIRFWRGLKPQFLSQRQIPPTEVGGFYPGESFS
jgi:putative transposase